MVNPFSVDQVAWWGAVLGTLSLLFNVWRVFRERPRLQIQIVSTSYEDGENTSIQKTPEGGTVTQLADYFHVEVANVGERPTTLMGVAATSRKGTVERIFGGKTEFDGELGISLHGFQPHYGNKFPYVLKPGEVWSCRVRKDQVLKLNKAGRPKLELHAVHWKSPHLIPFPKSNERVTRTK